MYGYIWNRKFSCRPCAARDIADSLKENELADNFENIEFAHEQRAKEREEEAKREEIETERPSL